MPAPVVALWAMPRRSALVLTAVAAGALWLTASPQVITGGGRADRVPALAPTVHDSDTAVVAGGGPVVDAEVLGVSVVRRANGARVVFTELRTDEVIRVEVRIIRYQTVVTRRIVRELRPGRWVVTLSLPAALARGRARAQVRLEDRTGAVAWYRQPIRVPAVGA